MHKRFWVANEVASLADYLHLTDYRLMGRNWSLYQSRKTLPNSALSAADKALRFIPALCNDIYLIGSK